MNFEFDTSKSKANLEKHGIDFLEAQQLWEDEAGSKSQREQKTNLDTFSLQPLVKSYGRPLLPIGRAAFG